MSLSRCRLGCDRGSTLQGQHHSCAVLYEVGGRRKRDRKSRSCNMTAVELTASQHAGPTSVVNKPSMRQQCIMEPSLHVQDCRIATRCFDLVVRSTTPEVLPESANSQANVSSNVHPPILPRFHALAPASRRKIFAAPSAPACTSRGLDRDMSTYTVW